MSQAGEDSTVQADVSRRLAALMLALTRGDDGEAERHAAALVADGTLDAAELELVRSLAGAHVTSMDAVAAAAGPRQRLGELAVAAGRVPAAEVERVLARQPERHQPLGELLREERSLSAADVGLLLAFQEFQSQRAPGPLRLGELLVRLGVVERGQLDQALRAQAGSGRRLGEELVHLGTVAREVVERVLALQQKLVAALLAVALALGAASPGALAASASSAGGDTAAAPLDFRIVIPRVFRVRSLGEPRAFDVTAADVARGFVEVRGSASYEVSTNLRDGFRIVVQRVGDLVSTVEVRGSHTDLVVSGSESSTLVDPGMPGVYRYDLDFRLQLSPGTTPGRYPWPVGVTMAPL